MRRQISRVLSLSGLTLGAIGWLVFLGGSVYAFTLSDKCPPVGLFPPRESAQMMISNVAWWFTLAGLPIALASVGVNFRDRAGWVAVAVNAAFWILLWGWMYGDVSTCQYR
jgi:hypothetical protein